MAESASIPRMDDPMNHDATPRKRILRGPPRRWLDISIQNALLLTVALCLVVPALAAVSVEA